MSVIIQLGIPDKLIVMTRVCDDPIGIPDKLVVMVRVCMKNSWCKIKFNSVISEDFTMTIGLRQEDEWSLVLFRIALESVIKVVLQNKPMDQNIGQG